MEVVKYLGFVVILSCIMCISGFSWGHCKGHSHGTRSSGLRINRFKISPDPLILPGKVQLQFDAEVSGHILPLPLSLEVNIWKLTKVFWFTTRTRIYGCCSYADICDALGIGSRAFTCPDEFLVNCIDCTCPPAPGLYNTSMSSVSVTVDDLPYYMHFFANGKFDVRFIMKDGNGEIVECLDTGITIRTVSTGRKRRDHPLEKRAHKQKRIQNPAYRMMPKYCYADENEATTILPVTDGSPHPFTTFETLQTFEEDTFDDTING